MSTELTTFLIILVLFNVGVSVFVLAAMTKHMQRFGEIYNRLVSLRARIHDLERKIQ